MKAKITKKTVDIVCLVAWFSGEGGDRDLFLWDSDFAGFGLKITPKGKKVYVLQYRINGQSKRFTIGTHGQGHWTATTARKEAVRLSGLIISGIDPAQEKSEKRKGLTLAELAERYLTEHALPKKKAWSIRHDTRMLKKIIIPALGNRKVETLTRADISKLHHKLRETPFMANRVLSLFSKMFNLSELWGYRPDGSNPCRHVQRYKEPKRERYLSGEEFARLGAALKEAEKTELPSAVLALRLLIFTGCRLSEILTLRWTEVDYEKAVLNLTDTKTGQKTVPLPGPALDALREAPRLAGNPYVCFGREPGQHLVALQKIWTRIRKKAGLEDVRHHDLRHSFASVGAGANMGLPLIGKLLGHTQAQTTARYAHLALDPVKEASEEIAARIAAAMNQEPKKSNVIELRPGGKN